MSKSKRAKEIHSTELSKRLELENAKKAQERRQNLICILAVLCGLALIAIVYFGVSFYNNGTIMRKRIAMETADTKVNNCMLSYYIYEEYRSFVNENYADLDKVYKLDNSKPLKKQDCTIKKGSWFDYFAGLASEKIKTALLYSSAAKSAGLKLEKADLDAIDVKIEELGTDAKAQGSSKNSYYEFMFGRGVRDEDLRACFALDALAEKYKAEKINSAFTYTDEQLNTAYNKSPKKNAAVDYLYLTVASDYKEDADEATKAAAKQAAAKWVERFKAANSVDSFKKTAKEYAAARYDIDPNDSALIDLLNINLYLEAEGIAYTDTDFGNAAFDKAVKEGNVIVTKEAEEQHTVYCITRPMYKPSYPTKNVGLIPFTSNAFGSLESAKSYAGNAQSSWKEDGYTAESFAKLCKTYCDDYSIAKNGGQMKNVKRAELDPLIDEWVFNGAVKENDSTLLQSADGYYLVWYIGDGHIAWQSEIISNLYDAFETSHRAELASKYKVTAYPKQIAKLSI